MTDQIISFLRSKIYYIKILFKVNDISHICKCQTIMDVCIASRCIGQIVFCSKNCSLYRRELLKGHRAKYRSAQFFLGT